MLSVLLGEVVRGVKRRDQYKFFFLLVPRFLLLKSSSSFSFCGDEELDKKVLGRSRRLVPDSLSLLHKRFFIRFHSFRVKN